LKNSLLLLPILGLSVAVAGCSDSGNALCTGVTGKCVGLASGASESQVSTAFGTATDGTTIIFGAGTFKFKNTVACAANVKNLTIKGAGIDKTTLDFKDQLTGSQAIACSGTDGISFSELTVADSLGDAIKVEGATGVIFRKVKITWTKSDLTAHGPYGLYPVQCKNVLIEGSTVDGASDAGIYVGQSENVVLRQNIATRNVAGIEIENTWYADVHDNEAFDNTAGILIFSLPIKDSPKPTTKSVRVYMNNSHDNNRASFAASGSVVGKVPAGVGLLIMAADQVEVFNNMITNSNTAQTGIVSYQILQTTWAVTGYVPDPTSIYIHDNTYTGDAKMPDQSNPLGIALALTFPSATLPTIMWDGFHDMTSGTHTITRPTNPSDICISNNGTANWANLDAPNTMSMVSFTAVKTDTAPYTCVLTALPAVSFPGL